MCFNYGKTEKKKFCWQQWQCCQELVRSHKEMVTAGINEATQMVTSYFDPATQLIYAIGAVVGLIGSVKVYNKLKLRHHRHHRRLAASWFGALYLLNGSGYHPTFILPLIPCFMNSYNINKGIGRTVEFKGLKAQYLSSSLADCSVHSFS